MAPSPTGGGRSPGAGAVRERVQSLAYSNFKDSIEDPEYHDAALAAWTAMHRYQQQADRNP